MLSFGEADVLLQKYASIPTGLTFTRRLWQYGQIFVYMLLLRLFDFEGAFFFVGQIKLHKKEKIWNKELVLWQ